MRVLDINISFVVATSLYDKPTELKKKKSNQTVFLNASPHKMLAFIVTGGKIVIC